MNPITQAELANNLAIRWTKSSIRRLWLIQWVPHFGRTLAQRREWLAIFNKRKPQLGFNSRERQAYARAKDPV